MYLLEILFIWLLQHDEEIQEVFFSNEYFHYEFESHNAHGVSDEVEIDYQYLTTYVYKRRVYKLPTAGMALLVVNNRPIKSTYMYDVI